MNSIRYIRRYVFAGVTSGLLIAALAGCPTVPSVPGVPDTSPQFEAGFDEGFAQDDWYWQGFFDSFDTKDFEPLFYQGDQIPFIDDLSFDAGFYDGTWYAYNDGYFTDYRYAFIVGFSEGYDAAFYPDYLDFLAGDFHVENLNGGWGDGYNDGFSEGRIFGAADFEAGFPFDWLDALRDFEQGTDLFFEELDLGTGEFGPVILYEYGVNPFTLKSGEVKSNNPRKPRPGGVPAIRGDGVKGVDDTDIFRPIVDEAAQELNVLPTNIDRNPSEVRFETTRLDRIEVYLSGASGIAKSAEGDTQRPRAVSPKE